MLEGQKNEPRRERAPLEKVVPLPAPFILHIDPCGACNFTCNFCPCNVSDDKREERHKLMPLELFKQIIDDVCTFPEQIKVICLYAFGEPLLHRDVFEMARYIKDRKACRELRLVTNGSRLCPENNQKLVDSGVDLVRISIEALDAEGYQDICRYQIDYERFVDNIRDLHERGKGRTRVSAKIVNAALKSSADVARFYSIYKPITDFTFVEDIIADWPGFEECVLPENGVVKSDNWAWIRNSYTRCSSPLTMLVVHSNGVVSPCAQDWNMELPLGDVHRDKLTDIWRGEKLRQFQLMQLERDRSQIPVCRNCFCSGNDNIDTIADQLAKKLREG